MVSGIAYHTAITDIHENNLWDLQKEEYNKLYCEALDRAEFEEDNSLPVKWHKYRDDMVDALAQDAADILYNYCAKDFNRNSSVLRAEETVQYKIMDYQFEGRIDQLRQYKDEIILLDFKSGLSPDVSDWALRLNFQLGAYVSACQQVFGILPNKMGIYRLPDHKPYQKTTWVAPNYKRIADSLDFTAWNKAMKPKMMDIHEYEALKTAQKIAKAKDTTKMTPWKSLKKDRTELAFRVGDERGPGLYTVKVTPQLVENISKDIQRVCAAIRRAEYYRNPIACSQCRYLSTCDDELAMVHAQDKVEAVTGW
jgi:hypothetical protein|tara:strand:+ start:752 stop:1681 length:930 start_codon:yes stop_codon:yes gene_type:complete